MSTSSFALLLAVLAAVQVAQAATYTVWIGYENPKYSVNVNKNFPETLQIHAGDKVIFKQMAHDPHTVTFHPGHALPDIFYNNIYLNLTVTTRTELPGGVYNGKFATSGIMALESKPLPTSWTVKFDTVGEFKYGCAVHGTAQNGSIVVVAPGTTIPTPADVAKQLKAIKVSLAASGKAAYNQATAAIKPPTLNADGNYTHYVQVGYYMAPPNDLLGFFPRSLTVSPGDKIQWSGSTFHTVSFLNKSKYPPMFTVINGVAQFNPVYLIPTGTTVLTKTGFINSGLMTDPKIIFTLTVGNIKGSLPYMCLPHASSKMLGLINVKAKKPNKG